MLARLRFPLILLLLAAAVCAITYATQRVWRENGLRSLQTLNEPRIQLLATAVRAEINRQDHLPVVLSFDHDVQEALTQPENADLQRRLNERLKRVSREADTRALFIIDPKGKVFASDDADVPGGQCGRDLSRPPYSRNALAPEQTAVLVTDPAGGPVRYYVAHTIRDDGRVIRDMYLLSTKDPSESRGEWDLMKIASTIPGSDAFRPLREGGCPFVEPAK